MIAAATIVLRTLLIRTTAIDAAAGIGPAAVRRVMPTLMRTTQKLIVEKKAQREAEADHAFAILRLGVLQRQRQQLESKSTRTGRSGAIPRSAMTRGAETVAVSTMTTMTESGTEAKTATDAMARTTDATMTKHMTAGIMILTTAVHRRRHMRQVVPTTHRARRWAAQKALRSTPMPISATATCHTIQTIILTFLHLLDRLPLIRVLLPMGYMERLLRMQARLLVSSTRALQGPCPPKQTLLYTELQQLSLRIPHPTRSPQLPRTQPGVPTSQTPTTRSSHSPRPSLPTTTTIICKRAVNV